MKKIKYLLMIIILLGITGCSLNTNLSDKMNITTSIYPIEFVVNTLYGNHSTINSLYPKDTDTNSFEITEVLIDQYKNSDLFVFNGLTNEKFYIKHLLAENKNLKIIDVASNMQYDHSIEELWLDPSNLLTIANNIKMGFSEYINSNYLIKEINENYENLKIELTMLDGKYYSMAKNASNNTIIVSDDAFKFLEKYGIKVVSIDPDTSKDKAISDAKDLIKNKTCSYIFVGYKEDNESINNFIEETGVSKIELYTMTNLQDINVEKNDYISLMNQNLENLKKELYR